MSISQSDVRQAKRLVDNLTLLITDTGGLTGYRPYVDKVLKDISGLDQVATKVLAGQNPMLAASRLINHPFSRNLTTLLIGENRGALSALNDLVLVAYQASQIAMKPKSKVTRKDLESYKYLQKLYRRGIETLKEQYGYAKSPKKFYKDQFSDLRDFIDDEPRYAEFFFGGDDYDDEDDDDEDEGVEQLLRAVGISTDPADAVTPPSLGAPISDHEIEEYFGGDMPTYPVRKRQSFASAMLHKAQEEMLRNPNYSPEKFSEVDYDFTGKTNLALIADRMESLVEGIQLILNRIYGKEIDFIPNPQDSTRAVTAQVDDSEDDGDSEFISEDLSRVERRKLLLEYTGLDFGSMSRAQLINIYNALGTELQGFDLVEVEPRTADESPNGNDDEEMLVSGETIHIPSEPFGVEASEEDSPSDEAKVEPSTDQEDESEDSTSEDSKTVVDAFNDTRSNPQ